MSEIGKRIELVISHDLAPSLKRNEFRRKGRTFHRISADRIDIVNVQGSKWSAGRVGEVTLNLGVYFPEVAELYYSQKPTGLPLEYDSILRERLGVLATGGHDKWWKIRRFTNLKRLSKRITSSLSKFGMPWLDQMADLDEVKAHVPRFVAAVISFHQGRIDEARSLIQESYIEAPRSAENAKLWAIRNNLDET